MHVPSLKHIGVDVELRGVRLDELVGDGRRLLHHVAEVTCQREVSSTAAQAHLDGQDLAAHLSPSQARGHTRHGVLDLLFVVVHGHAEHLAKVVHSDFLVESLVSHHLLGTVAHHVADAALQVTHTRLTGVVVDDVHDDVLGESDLLGVQAVFLHLLGDEVALGDFVFLFAQIAAQVDNLHTVAQGGMDGREVVGRSDEEDLREVVVQLDEVVVEGVVLLGVKDFEQGGLRVTLDVVAAHLVDFVEDEDGVARLDLTQVLDDTTRHGTDIGLSVSTQLRLIAHAAK